MATEIIKMPNKGLNSEERNTLRQELFSKAHLSFLEEIGYFHQQVMAKTEAIIVLLPNIPGYLGDLIQNSRLPALLAQSYPNKVYTATDLPNLFGKYPLLKMPDPSVDQMKFDSTDQSGKFLEKKEFRSYFLPISSFDSLTSGVFIKRNQASRVPQKFSNAVDLDQVESTHQVHMMQAVWEVIYRQGVDPLASPTIHISSKDQLKSDEIFDALPINEQLNIIIHPDSSKIKDDWLFYAKAWENEKWVHLLKRLPQIYPNIALFLSQGADHSDLSGTITNKLAQDDIPLTVLPKLPLAQYAGLVDRFPKDKTLFVGLESMPAGHLAPSLGLRSIVLSDAQLYCRHYGPWNGLVVANNEPDAFTRAVEVDAVLEAINRSVKIL